MNYTIQQLQYLIALHQHGSFSKAAEHCHVTQPTLSIQIKKLESDLGIELLDRSKHPVRFTELGMSVLAKAREAVGELRELNELITSSHDELSGELRVGIIPTLAPYLVPHFLGAFLEAYPSIHLRITEFKTEEIIERLKSERLDVGVLATPLHEPGVSEQPLFYEQLLCYMSPGLARAHGNTVDISDILDERLWVLSEGNCFRNQTFNLCSLRQTDFAQQNFNYESGSLEALMRLVELEGGSTIIPELALASMSEAKLDHVKFIGQTRPVREVSTVTRKKGPKTKLIEALRGQILEALPKEIRNNDATRKVEIYMN